MNLSSLLDRPIAFHRSFVTLTGSVTAALLLSQAIYWAKRCTLHPDGKNWFYKTMAEWEEETGLSRREQESARKRLRDLKILDEKKQGIPAKTYFSINFNELDNLLAVQTRMAESANLCCTKTPTCDGENRQCNTETTTEITTDIKTLTPQREVVTVMPDKSKLEYFDPKTVKPNNVSSSVWDAWIAYRKKIGKKLHATSWMKQAQMLEKQVNPEEIINNSIMNGWQGLFPRKTPEPPRKTIDTNWINNLEDEFF